LAEDGRGLVEQETRRRQIANHHVLETTGLVGDQDLDRIPGAQRQLVSRQDAPCDDPPAVPGQQPVDPRGDQDQPTNRNAKQDQRAAGRAKRRGEQQEQE
jgi:hypothetical protein